MSGVPAGPWAANPFLDENFLATVGLLVAVLLAGAVALAVVERWRKRQLATHDDSAESLTSFRALYDRGEITEAEYQAVRDRLARRLKQEAADASAVKHSTSPGPPAESPGPASGATPDGGTAGPPPPAAPDG